jgi:clan AA aspartic protease (TIGR02281 family)
MRLTARVLCAAALCALLWCDAAWAEIYRWTDADGQLHFTQSLDQVPPQYREQARRSAASPGPARLQTYSNSARRRAAADADRYDEQIRIPFVRDGSLMRVNVLLNDQVSAPFLIDTGASGISLPSHVAEQLGIRIRPDTPHVQMWTAAGVVTRPIVMLQSVQLGRARVEGLEATVNPAMQVGLLGGTFFNNFVYQVDAAESEIVLWLRKARCATASARGSSAIAPR